jgi:hypothetical protein
MTEILVDPVEFLEGDLWTVGYGVAIEATTFNTRWGAFLEEVIVSQMVKGTPVVRHIEGMMLLDTSYRRVCQAVGIDP